MLSDDDRKRIADAVTQAELGTTGEITCVLAQQVSNYREVPLAWAALASLCLPPLLVLTGLHETLLHGGWSDGTGEDQTVRALAAYAGLQAVLFVVVALLANWPPLRRLLTPGMLKRHRVGQVARHHYAAVGTRLPPDSPHILIFACFQDHRVELVANPAIHAAEGQALWEAAVAAVVQGMKSGQSAEGFIQAVQMCGDAMARHFPASGPDENRLSNEIVVM
jgi:putative membrane protein